MSRPSRWVLGCFALLFAAIFIYSEHLEPSNNSPLVYGVAAFSGLIAVACFTQKWRGLAVRVIGFTVFLAYVSYLVFELVREPAKPYAGETEPHWLNAIIGLVVFGLPGLYVTARGKYPAWGNGAKAFNGEMDSPSDEDEESHRF
jgi:peptidoglycan/LPS O-acetylase OafA/YrhL